MSHFAQNQVRFHNPKVGGSIPPPATNNAHRINYLISSGNLALGTSGGKMGQEICAYDAGLSQLVEIMSRNNQQNQSLPWGIKRLGN